MSAAFLSEVRPLLRVTLLRSPILPSHFADRTPAFPEQRAPSSGPLVASARGPKPSLTIPIQPRSRRLAPP